MSRHYFLEFGAKSGKLLCREPSPYTVSLCLVASLLVMPDVIVQKMNSWRACIRKEKKLNVKNSIKKHTWHPPARAWSRQTFLIAIQIFMRLAQMQSFWSDGLDMFTELFVPGFASYRRWTKIAWQEIEHPFGCLACRQQLAVFYTNMTVEFWERKKGRIVARDWDIVSGMTLSFFKK